MFNRALFRTFTAFQKPFSSWTIVTGDNVIVNTGKDKGKVGEVLRINRKTNQVLVQNVNIKLKRIKGDPQGEVKGGSKPVIRPLHVSKVNLVDPESGKPTRVRKAYLEDGTKVRISKRSGSIIPKPNRDNLKYDTKHAKKQDGSLDTPTGKVLEVTYKGEDFERIKQEFMQYIENKERIEKLLVFSK
jgi:large subunit ribosomal protein L24